ncbi:PREDICTED: uncharacterized protein LOC107073304 [Polistes dominula]|uniref:Uncharacterized protein LOC107073304 n=1 Tax=Polistes dominula TaxID=743375 RepID=A0ABM1JA92_POLDO|nr:PREDICTED: uncharacterized protein LOC107073304 [Polistes dominula]
MKSQNKLLCRKLDPVEVKSFLNDKILIYQKKLECYEKRSRFRLENRKFELYRGKFYRELESIKINHHNVNVEDIKNFWSSMWKKDTKTKEPKVYSEYVNEVVSLVNKNDKRFLSYSEFLEIVSRLPNWKAAGPDGIYNFFVKKLTSIHEIMYNLIKKQCLDGFKEEEWLYKGLTYLIPKEECHKGENQLGTIRSIQGAKEQAMLNISLNMEHDNKLKSCWIDVKKAFDSIEHDYLLECLKNLNFPIWILNFVKNITSKWSIDVLMDNKKLFTNKISKGILQGDSLSPLLFVICMDPLSKKLNSIYPMVNVEIEKDKSYMTNHLLFIDDIKLISKDKEILKRLMTEVMKFFELVGLEKNKEKSATNCRALELEANFIDNRNFYKYLGVTEYSNRILNIEPEVFEGIDAQIRLILIKNGIHLQPACKEKLYLSRKELGRGLCSLEFKSEREYLRVKYNLSNNNTLKDLYDSQRKNLYNKINAKPVHKILYKAEENQMVSILDSSIWLSRGNVQAKSEGIMCYVQDRNMFNSDKQICPHYKASRKTVDHLATRCEQMLDHDYMRRHNEIVKCLHLLLCKKYNIKAAKRLRGHSVQQVVSNGQTEIRVDTTIRTDITVKCNKPDILVESEKLRKYDILANKLTQIYSFQTKIIPFVLTWDGIVTKYHRKYKEALNIPFNLEAYIQYVSLKKTMESISMDFRRQDVDLKDFDEVNLIAETVVSSGVCDSNKNTFLGEKTKFPHCKEKRRTVDHLATRCDRMLSFDYTRRYNEVARSIHLQLCQAYNLKASKKLQNHSVQEVLSNDKIEIRVDTKISTDVKIQHNKHDIFVYDKIKKEITLIEVGITSQENLQSVESEKMRKYDLLANELGLIYKAKTKIISYIMTWDGLVTIFHKTYVRVLGISTSTDYIQRGQNEGGTALLDIEDKYGGLCCNVDVKHSKSKFVTNK